MKKNIFTVLILTALSAVQGQTGILGVDYFGGGLGPFRGWMHLDIGTPFQKQLDNFKLEKFDQETFLNEGVEWLKLFPLNGVEGYGHITERWRAGAIFSYGSVSNSKDNSRGEFNLLLIGVLVESVIWSPGNHEFAFPGIVIGAGRASFILEKNEFNMIWDEFSENIKDYEFYNVSSKFMFFQTHLGYKWQFLNRSGFRLVLGLNLGTIDSDSWEFGVMNQLKDVFSGGPEVSLFSPFARAVLYLGI